MRGLNIFISVLVVGVIAYLLGRESSAKAQTSNPAPTPTPAPTPSTTDTSTTPTTTGATATPVPTPASISVERKADGKYYLTGVPAPYDSYPVLDLLAGFTENIVYTSTGNSPTDAYYYYYAPTTMTGKILAVRYNRSVPPPTGWATADAYIIDKYRTSSLHPALWIMSPEKTLIAGSF